MAQTFGDRLKQAREEVGLTQGELAEKTLSIAKTKGLTKGVSQQIISRIESNKSGSSKHSNLLAEAVNKPILWLLEGVTDPLENMTKEQIDSLDSLKDWDPLYSAFDSTYAISSDSKRQLMDEVREAIESNSITDAQAESITTLIQTMKPKSQSGRFKKT